MNENELLDFTKAVEGMMSEDELKFWDAIDELSNQDGDNEGGVKGQNPDHKKTKNFYSINYI